MWLLHSLTQKTPAALAKHIHLLHYVNKIWIHKKAHWQSVSLVGKGWKYWYKHAWCPFQFDHNLALKVLFKSASLTKQQLDKNATQQQRMGGRRGSQILTRYVLSFIIISPSTLSRLQPLRKIDDARCCPLFHTFRALGSVSNMDLLRLFTFHSPRVCHHVHMLWICKLPHLRICLVIGHLASGPLTRH